LQKRDSRSFFPPLKSAFHVESGEELLLFSLVATHRENPAGVDAENLA